MVHRERESINRLESAIPTNEGVCLHYTDYQIDEQGTLAYKKTEIINDLNANSLHTTLLVLMYTQI